MNRTIPNILQLSFDIRRESDALSEKSLLVAIIGRKCFI